jgi:very-short-patch-repair endonuclease
MLDFACLERKVVIELDGGQHVEAIVVPRFWINEVSENRDGVLEVIWTTLQVGSSPSPPDPSLEAEG